MPPLSRPALRTLLAAALVTVGTAAWVLPALAEMPSIEVEIVAPDGDEAYDLLSEVDADIDPYPYPIRERNRPDREISFKEKGVSVFEILRKNSLTRGYGSIQIERPNGSTLTLTKAKVEQVAGAFLYVDDAGDLRFFRRSDRSDDYNARDNFKIGDSSITFSQTPSRLDVSLEADKTEIEPGGSVSFTAKVSGAPEGTAYRLTWDFKDGPQEVSSALRKKHTFEKQGPYNVIVTAKLPGSTRSDQSNVVKIQVGDEKESDKDRDGGGMNSTGTADSGAAFGSAGLGSTYGSGSSTAPTPSAPTLPTPSPKPLDPPDIATAGPTVEGNLLADATDPPPASILESAAKAARDGQRKDDAPDGAGVPEAALSAAGILALLGLGAGMEMRQGRPLRLRLPRRAA